MKKILEQDNNIAAVHTAIHPYQVTAVLRTIPVSIVFVRPGMWNFQWFQGFTSLPQFVFLSSVRNKIKVDPDGSPELILREPYNVLQVTNVVEEASEHNAGRSADFFFVKFERRWRKIVFVDIELIEKKPGHYVLICTKEHSYLVAGSLNSWMMKLPEEKFIRPADNIVLPVAEVAKLTGVVYPFRGRDIKLTFRFARQARKEMNESEIL